MIGILGNAFMIYNIDSSWEVKKRIYLIFVITVAILSVYAVIWIKCVMKRPMFKAYQIKEVMAMESDLYQINHNPEVAKKLHLDAVPEIEYAGGCQHRYSSGISACCLRTTFHKKHTLPVNILSKRQSYGKKVFCKTAFHQLHLKNAGICTII